MSRLVSREDIIRAVSSAVGRRASVRAGDSGEDSEDSSDAAFVPSASASSSSASSDARSEHDEGAAAHRQQRPEIETDTVRPAKDGARQHGARRRERKRASRDRPAAARPRKRATQMQVIGIPDDILEHILQFVADSGDLLRWRAVSRQWKRVIERPDLWRDVTLSIRSDLARYEEQIEVLCQRFLCHATAMDLSAPSEYRSHIPAKILTKFIQAARAGEGLVSFSASRAKVAAHVVEALAEHADSLVDLSLSNSDCAASFAPLRSCNLKRIILCDSFVSSQRSLFEFPALETLDLSRTTFGSTSSSRSASVPLSQLVHFVAEGCRHLQDVDVTTFLSAAENVQTISLANCPNIRGEWTLPPRLPHLKRLVLDRTGVSTSTVEALVASGTCLQLLSLCWCSNIDTFVWLPAASQHLQVLCLDGTSISDDEIHAAEAVATRLRALHVNSCRNLARGTRTRIARAYERHVEALAY